MKHSLLLACLMVVMTLSACGFDRDARDQQLVKGCRAAVQSLLSQNHAIEEIKGAQFSFSPALGNGRNYRVVAMSASIREEWYVTDKSYECVYAEAVDLAGFGHKSEIYQVKINDQIHGRDDKGNIIGDVPGWMALSDTVKRAMTE